MLKEILKLFFPITNEVQNKTNQLNECFDGWKKYRDQLIAQKRDLEKLIDKTIFTVSSGAIGISLVIIDKLFPEGKHFYIFLIIALSWISLIIYNLSMSFFFSLKKD